MAVDIVIPSLGESINEVRLGRWHRSEGDWVEKDDLLVEIESDKVTQEFPSPVAGILHITETEGTDLPIGATIGAVDNEATKPAGDPAPEPSAPAAPDATTADPISMPAAQVENATEAASPIRVTPLARKVAQGRGVDIGSVPGTGLHGKITKSDVLSASPASAAPSEPIITVGDGVLQRGERRVRMSKLRQRIAERLVHAQRTAAMLTTFNEADMSHVIELRKAHKEEFNDRFGVKLGFMSFFIKAAVAALKKYPLVNAFIDGDEIVEHDYVDMSVAVGTDKGLVVPVIRNADRSSFSEIESSILELAGRAREGRLGIDEMTGGTFTISNGGVYGSMLSTPILNPPQSGILGLHRIQNRPIEDPDNAGQIVLRPMMYLALSYDHRIVDGSEAVGFLVHLKQCIEHPERLLLDM